MKMKVLMKILQIYLYASKVLNSIKVSSTLFIFSFEICDMIVL